MHLMKVTALLSLLVYAKSFWRSLPGYTANLLKCGGHRHILASTGVQQGDLLGPLLFFLKFVCSISSKIFLDFVFTNHGATPLSESIIQALVWTAQISLVACSLGG